MKKYVKEIQRDGYTIVTTADDNGNYYQYCEAIDTDGKPFKISEYWDTLYRMGWKSVSEFLKHRIPGYKVITE